MPMNLARRLSAVQPSATLAVSERAAALRAAGRTIYPFGVGEPDFDTPASIRDAAKRALDAGQTRYTAVAGTNELRAAIARRSAESRGVPCSPSQIVVSVGAKHALFNLAVALYEPGDEIVIPAPYWVSYPEQVRLVGAEPVIVETREDEGWILSPGALEKAISPRTKALILCSPSNPTGHAYPARAMRALLEVAERHEFWIIVDEIYQSLVYSGFEHVSALSLASEAMRPRILVVDGVSKTYAMTGWRIGWSITPPSLACTLDMVQGQSTSNPSAVAQAAALEAITGSQSSIEEMRVSFEARRARMVEGLRSLPGVRCRPPEGAFYAFADVRGLYGLRADAAETGRIQDDVDVAKFLLEEAGIAAVPGTPFGGPGYVRFSYATSEANIDAGVRAAREAIDGARARG